MKVVKENLSVARLLGEARDRDLRERAALAAAALATRCTLLPLPPPPSPLSYSKGDPGTIVPIACGPELGHAGVGVSQVRLFIAQVATASSFTAPILLWSLCKMRATAVRSHGCGSNCSDSHVALP